MNLVATALMEMIAAMEMERYAGISAFTRRSTVTMRSMSARAIVWTWVNHVTSNVHLAEFHAA